MKIHIDLIKAIVARCLVVLAIMASLHPLQASEEPEGPEIQRRNIKGVGQFAAEFTEIRKIYRGCRVGIVYDFHGVMTRFSMPIEDAESLPRGDMVDYVKYLDSLEEEYVQILSSAWDKAEEVVRPLKDLGLAKVFKLEGELEHGVGMFGKSQCRYYKLGNMASVQRLTPFPAQPKYYNQKALSPLVIQGDDCTFDVMCFVDDNSDHIRAFAKDAAEAPYFRKLKKLVLFHIPPINGEVREDDQIALEFLPAEFRTHPYRPKGYVNPLAQAGHYSIDGFGEERPTVILAEPPEKYFSPSRRVLPPLARYSKSDDEESKIPADILATYLQGDSDTPRDPLRQAGFHFRADFEDGEDYEDDEVLKERPSAKFVHPLNRAGYHSFSAREEKKEEEKEPLPSIFILMPEPDIYPLFTPIGLSGTTSKIDSLAMGSGLAQSHAALFLNRSTESCRDMRRSFDAIEAHRRPLAQSY